MPKNLSDVPNIFRLKTEPRIPMCDDPVIGFELITENLNVICLHLTKRL